MNIKLCMLALLAITPTISNAGKAKKKPVTALTLKEKRGMAAIFKKHSFHFGLRMDRDIKSFVRTGKMFPCTLATILQERPVSTKFEDLACAALREGASSEDYIGVNMLHLATCAGYAQVVSFLLSDPHRNVDAQSHIQESAFHWACLSRDTNPEVVKLLLKRSHNFNTPNHRGLFPLDHLLSIRSRCTAGKNFNPAPIQIAELLVSHGAKTNTFTIAKFMETIEQRPRKQEDKLLAALLYAHNVGYTNPDEVSAEVRDDAEVLAKQFSEKVAEAVRKSTDTSALSPEERKETLDFLEMYPPHSEAFSYFKKTSLQAATACTILQNADLRKSLVTALEASITEDIVEPQEYY